MKNWIIDDKIVPYNQDLAKKKSKEEMVWLCEQSKNTDVQRIGYILRTTNISSIPLIEVVATALDMNIHECEHFIRTHVRMNDLLFSFAFLKLDESEIIDCAVQIFGWAFIENRHLFLPSKKFKIGHHLFKLFDQDINEDFYIKTPRTHYEKISFSSLTF